MSQTAPSIIEALKCLHVIGLSAGLGGALLADLLGLRALFSSSDVAPHAVVRQLHMFVFIGLALLWASGCAIALVRFDLDTVPSKVLAKLALTTLLTLNAFCIRRRLLPLLTDRGRPLACHLRPGEILDVVAFGSVSFTCWFSALFMAKLSLLQQMDTVRLVGLALVFWGLSGATLYLTVALARLSALLRRRESTADSPAGADADPPAPPFSIFRERAPAALLELAEAARDRGGAEIAETADALKSMSRSIGAARLAMACERIALQARAGAVRDLPSQLAQVRTDLVHALARIEDVERRRAPALRKAHDLRPAPGATIFN